MGKSAGFWAMWSHNNLPLIDPDTENIWEFGQCKITIVHSQIGRGRATGECWSGDLISLVDRHCVCTWLYLLLILLVWHAPLGVHSTKRRHQSPEWTILSLSYCLIQGEIVRYQVLLDSLHPRGSRTSWWSPPVLWRGSSYDTPGICLVWHSRSVAEQRKKPCLDNSRQAWLPGCPSHLFIPHVMVPFDS